MNSLRLSCLAKPSQNATLCISHIPASLANLCYYRVFWGNVIVNRLSHSDKRLEMRVLLRMFNFQIGFLRWMKTSSFCSCCPWLGEGWSADLSVTNLILISVLQLFVLFLYLISYEYGVVPWSRIRYLWCLQDQHVYVKAFFHESKQTAGRKLLSHSTVVGILPQWSFPLWLTLDKAISWVKGSSYKKCRTHKHADFCICLYQNKRA